MTFHVSRADFYRIQTNASETRENFEDFGRVFTKKNGKKVKKKSKKNGLLIAVLCLGILVLVVEVVF